MDDPPYPKGAQPLFIDELLLKVKDAESLEGMSVRVTGKLDKHDPIACLASVVDPQTGQQFQVDTSLIEPFQSRKGFLLQFVGELDCLSDSFDVIIKARLVRPMDGLDFVMYKKAVMAQRQYLESRKT